VGVINMGGGYEATGIRETIRVDEVAFWVVSEGIVDVVSAIDVVDMEVIVGIGPSCEMTGRKVDEGNTELTGAIEE
ncbi:hypothetical protein KI387_040070, partial [Taxus chinensis]